MDLCSVCGTSIFIFFSRFLVCPKEGREKLRKGKLMAISIACRERKVKYSMTRVIIVIKYVHLLKYTQGGDKRENLVKIPTVIIINLK